MLLTVLQIMSGIFLLLTIGSIIKMANALLHARLYQSPEASFKPGHIVLGIAYAEGLGTVFLALYLLHEKKSLENLFLLLLCFFFLCLFVYASILMKRKKIRQEENRVRRTSGTHSIYVQVSIIVGGIALFAIGVVLAMVGVPYMGGVGYVGLGVAIITSYFGEEFISLLSALFHVKRKK